MPRFLKLTLLSILLLLPYNTFADGIDLGVFTSYWGTEDGEDAFGLGTRFAFPVISDPFQFEFRVSIFDDVTDSGEPDVEVLPLEFGLAFRPDMPFFSPFASAGVGYYMLDAANGVSIDDEWGWYLAGGLEAELPFGFAIFAELNYRGIEGEVSGDLSDFDDFDFTNAKADYDLSGFGANVGINFSW